MKPMKILVLGDVSRSAGTEYVAAKLWKYRKENEISLVIVNGENSAEQNGIDRGSADALLSAGADVITTGNHAFKRYDAKHLFEENSNILRPANYPDRVAGEGAVLFDVDGMTVLIVNLLGIIMMEPLENPFFTIEKILKKYEGKYDLSVLDIHAEATSEKIALAHYLDGRMTLVFGTHTHVATADECILSGGTGYISDLGMTGPVDTILGVTPQNVIDKMVTGMPTRFLVPQTGRCKLEGVVAELDEQSGHCTSIRRIRMTE